jgi:O-antigen/teichoic acid export membrane protein
MIRSLLDHQLLRRLLTVLSLDVLVKASSIVLLPIYLRLMTQEQYGLFSYILSISYAVSALLNLGLYVPQSKLYHEDRDPGRRGKLIFSIHMLLLAGLLLLVVPVYLFDGDARVVRLLFRNPFPYDRYRPWILLLILSSLFAYMLTNFFYTAEKIHRIKRYSLWRIIGVNGVSILALYLLRSQDPIRLRLIAIGCTELTLLALFYGDYLRESVQAIDRQLLIKCLRLGLPMMLSAVFNIIINFGDKFFLEKNVDYKILSVYYLATACAGVVSLFSNSLQNVWLPLFFQEKDLAQNLRKTNKLVGRLSWGLSALSLGIVIAVWCCLRTNLIPQRYAEIVYVLPLLLAGQVVICLALLYSNYLVYFDRTSLILWSGLAVSLTSSLLNMVLVPAWQIYGAAVTLLIANSVYLVLYYYLAMYYKNLRDSDKNRHEPARLSPQ